MHRRPSPSLFRGMFSSALLAPKIAFRARPVLIQTLKAEDVKPGFGVRLVRFPSKIASWVEVVNAKPSCGTRFKNCKFWIANQLFWVLLNWSLLFSSLVSSSHSAGFSSSQFFSASALLSLLVLPTSQLISSPLSSSKLFSRLLSYLSSSHFHAVFLSFF